jgi:hypothetical protein
MKPLLLVCVTAILLLVFVPSMSLKVSWGGNTETPQVNVPVALRQHNWGKKRNGSCVHASVVTALRWQQQYRLADWWKTNHSGGEHYESLKPQLDQAGVKYVATVDDHDVSFLEWAVETRRGCMIACNEHAHATFLCHLDSEYAGIIGTNFPDEIIWVERETFLEDWRQSRSWAVAVVYTPAPPLAEIEE